MVTVVASHKLAKDVVREEEAMTAVVDVDEDEDTVEGATATVWSSTAWMCQTTPTNSLIMR